MTKRQITFTFSKEIKAPVAKVWSVISAPGGLVKYHPFCAANHTIEWNGIGAKDEIVYHNGLKLKRQFIAWDENEGYELLIGNGEVPSARVIWSIAPDNEHSSSIRITINAYIDVILKQFPYILRKFVAWTRYSSVMNQYIKSVVKGLKYYVETGKEVRMNQFGYNKFFSIEQKADG